MTEARKRGRPRKHPIEASGGVAVAEPPFNPYDTMVPGPADKPLEDASLEDDAPPEPAKVVVAPPGHQPSINLSMEMFEQLLVAVKSSGGNAGDNPTLAVAIRAIEAQAKNSERLAEEFKRTVRRSNDSHPNLSVFTFDARCPVCVAVAAGDETAMHVDDKGRNVGLAHPKPELRYDTYFCNGRQNAEQLTPLEVELYNAFEGSKEARDGKWSADLSRDGSKRRLSISVPARGYDDMISLPSLTQILAELLYGSDVASPDAALARISALEAKIKELEAARPSSGR